MSFATLTLPDDLRRDSIVDVRYHTEGYLQALDRETLWYDALWTGGRVCLVGPRLNNLLAPFRAARFALDGQPVRLARLRRYKRHYVAELRAARAPQRVSVQIGGWRGESAVNATEPAGFARLNTLFMLQKDNDLHWIVDHARFHQKVHGLQAVFFLDNGQRLGRVFSHFRRETCYPVQVGPDPRMVKWHEREHAASAIASLIQDITVRHVFEECIDIPPNTETIVQYYAPPGQLKAYEQMRKHKVAELENQIVTAVNAAVVMGKLLQIASGALYDSNGNVAKVDSGRYEMICDLIESRKQCVVFFQWKHQRDELVKQFEKAGITFTVLDGETPAKDRAENVRLFQAGFYRVMLAHPQSAAHGLTLTRATTTIWASPSHNVEHVLQGNRRTYRAGQTQKTETIYILAAGTIEAEVHRKMSEKNIRQGDMLEWMKSLFKGGL